MGPVAPQSEGEPHLRIPEERADGNPELRPSP